MSSASEIAVTLAPELFDRLRTEAKLLGVSLEWLVASLVLDTIEGMKPEPIPIRA
jgi:hypothetical protein